MTRTPRFTCVSDGKPLRRLPVISKIRNSPRSSVETTFARAVQDAGFKNCCLRSGRYDGSRKNHFFPRVIARSALAVRKHFLRAEEHGLPLLKDNSHVHQLVRSSTNAIVPRVGGASDERRPSWLSTTQRFSTAALRRSRSRFRVRARFATRAAAIRSRWMTGRGSTAS